MKNVQLSLKINKMKNIPDKIFLVIDDECEVEDFDKLDHEFVCWCQSSIDGKDLEYILKDKVIQLMNEMMNDILCKPANDSIRKRIKIMKQFPNSNNIAEFINEWAKINIK